MTDNVVLDERIALGFRANPAWKTTVVQAANGREVRNSAWSNAQMRYIFRYNNMDIADARALVAFFHGRRGRQRSFLLKAYDDFRLENEPIGTGTGALTAFQAKKTYDTLNPWVRIIKHIKSGTPVAKVDGTPVTISNYTNGLITLASAPANGTTVTLSCEFYVPVRFDVDEFDITVDGPEGRFGVISGLSCVEVRE